MTSRGQPGSDLNSCREIRGRARIAALVSVAGLLLAAGAVTLCCGQTSDIVTKPGPDTVVIQAGPFDVTQDELDRWVEWTCSVDTSLAPAFARRVLLEDHVLPRKVAEATAGPDRVAEVQERADQLANLVAGGGGSVELLRTLGKQYGVDDDSTYHPQLNRLEAPVAHAVFTTPVGFCTRAIRVATGCIIAGVVAEDTKTTPKRRISRVFLEYSKQLTTPEIRRRVLAIKEGKAWVHPYHRDDLETFFGSLVERPIRQ